ncbi:MAG: hypothetical protein HEEMFOPI_01876 [Holosporales bacterium]
MSITFLKKFFFLRGMCHTPYTFILKSAGVRVEGLRFHQPNQA